MKFFIKYTIEYAILIIDDRRKYKFHHPDLPKKGEEEIEDYYVDTSFTFITIENIGDLKLTLIRQTSVPASDRGSRTNPSPNYVSQPAPSPYNFIPLNESVIHFIEDNNAPLYSGSIDLKITNLTYLFTRNQPDDSSFFTVDGRPTIPGSSVRGMLRNLCEIITYGNFNAFENRRLYLRNFAGTTSAKDYYSIRINNEDAKLGFLDYKRTTKSFVLYPLAGPEEEGIDSNRTEFRYSYDEQTNEWVIRSGSMRNKKDWRVEYIADKHNEFTIDKEVIDDYKSDRTRKSRGDMEDITVTAKNRRLKDGTPLPHGLPIFYTVDQESKVRSIGHCKMHRIPYHYEIGNYHHIPEKLQTNNLDISSSIFGPYIKNNTLNDSDVSHRPGKISVHDAYMDHEKNVFLEQRQLQVLGSPNPTSFQLYLTQPGEGSSYKVDRKKMKHWGSDDAFIRGYKQYWHRITKNSENFDPFYKDKDGKYSSKQKGGAYPHPIKALKAGNIFKSKIRFKNLSAIELGALLSVIELPEGCKHKLGMAKPLGFGSVQIDLESITIQDTVERYKKVFTDDLKSWHDPKLDNPSKESLIGAFESFMKAKLNMTSDFWEDDRMKSLKMMLSYDEKKNASDNWLKDTRYQIGGSRDEEYGDRKVLPSPSEVVSKYQ